MLGNNPPGSGISRIYTPEQFRSRTYDFVLDDDTLLHLGYQALTPLELDLPFALKIDTPIQSAVLIVATGTTGGPWRRPFG